MASLPLPPRRRKRPGRLRDLGASLLCVLALLTALSGCTGGSDDTTAELTDRLQTAKRALDRAESIRLSLRADRLPAGVDGIASANGVATHAPAFRGRLTIAASGLLDGQTVEVVAVDGDVYAQTPFSSSFIQVDPADFGAPDPAKLLDRRSGLSTLLSEATALSESGQERAGEEVLTAVSGTVPGSVVAGIFPSASAGGTFDATFWLDGDDRLRRAEISGPFYAGSPPVTYEITVDASEQPVKITAP